MKERPVTIYCDGGTIGKNPSRLGGTYAWLWLSQDGRVLKTGKGIVTPKQAGTKTITNNVMELWAAVEGLQLLPEGWGGTIWTDSKVTMFRLIKSQSFKGIPLHLEQKIRRIRKVLDYTVQLCAGHPTKVEFARGRRKRNGLPVSRWNVYVDKECNRLSENYLKDH